MARSPSNLEEPEAAPTHRFLHAQVLVQAVPGEWMKQGDRRCAWCLNQLLPLSRPLVATAASDELGDDGAPPQRGSQRWSESFRVARATRGDAVAPPLAPLPQWPR